MTTRQSSQRSGVRSASRSRGPSKARLEPATRSFTELDTSTPPSAATDETRAGRHAPKAVVHAHALTVYVASGRARASLAIPAPLPRVMVVTPLKRE
jgi:hypothetical protein